MTTSEKCKICGLLINPGECRGTYEVCNAISRAYQNGIEEGYFKGVSDFAIEIEKAYLDDNIDECEINRIEMILKRRT